MKATIIAFSLSIVSFTTSIGQETIDSILKVHVAVQGIYLFPTKVEIINSEGVIVKTESFVNYTPVRIATFANASLNTRNTHFSVKVRRKVWKFDNRDVQFIRIRKILFFYFVKTNPKSERPWINNPL